MKPFSQITRRKFLQLSGIGAATLASFARTGHAAPAFLKKQSAFISNKVQNIPTVCNMCKARCLVSCKVVNGRVVKIDGLADNPYNGMAVCARGNAASELLYDVDRLKYPMKRVGERGEGKWARISWGEAIDTISQQLEKALRSSGPKALALFAKGSSSSYIKELFAEFSIAQVNDVSSEQCGMNRELAYRLTFGNDGAQFPLLDYANTSCVVLVGSHLGENVDVAELQNLARARGNGAKLIVVDPRFSSVAAKADNHLMIRPGTDQVLLMGWINYIIDAGLYDVGYVSQHVTGFAELRRDASFYSLEKAAEITGIPAEVIRQTATMIAAAAPGVIIHPGNHSAWYGNDVQRLRTQAILAGLLGSWGSRGGLLPRTAFGDELPPVHANQQAIAELLKNRDWHGATIIKKMEKGAVRVVGCWGQNPLHSIVNPYRTRKAFMAADFVFACDVLPSDTTLFADIILPEASFLERYDVVDRYQTTAQNFIAVRTPVVAPAYEARDPYWIVKQLSTRLGRGDGFRFADVRARLDHELAKDDLSLAKIAAEGGFALLPKVAELENNVRFATPSGKIEFFPKSLSADRLTLVPNYDEVPAPPQGFARLLSGRSPVHSQTLTCNNKWLRHEMAENELWLNEQLAEKLLVKAGERLFLENQDGVRSMKPIVVKLTPGIRADCVYLVHGFGARSPLLQQGFDQGVGDMMLMTRSRRDQFSGSRGLRVNFVRLIKNGKPLDMRNL
ncbi:MAG: molybdopterin-dependent oxidoreductase [Desulfobulbaceae bacterium]|nr:molybdopterin-dependent oxidoreductase [Desulfobulbaceae bacterium]HIJ78869.1 molybdopterin-dependent oxidoreductase [Deltaproteobacteria bacterium]